MEAAPDDALLGFGQSHAFDEIDEKLPFGKGDVKKLLNYSTTTFSMGTCGGFQIPHFFLQRSPM